MKEFRVLLFARGSSEAVIRQYLDQLRKVQHSYDSFQVDIYSKVGLGREDELVARQFQSLRSLWRYVETPKDQFDLVIVDDMSRSNVTFLLSMLLYRIPLFVEEDFVERHHGYLVPGKTVVPFSRRQLEGMTFRFITFMRNFAERMALVDDAYRFALKHKSVIWKGINWEDDEEPVRQEQKGQRAGLSDRFRWKKKAQVKLSELDGDRELELTEDEQKEERRVGKDGGQDGRQGLDQTGGQEVEQDREDPHGDGAGLGGRESAQDDIFRAQSAGVVRETDYGSQSAKGDLKASDQLGKHNPQVDLVIISYNTLTYLKECIQSIRKHTNYPHQIIVVDNGSTDGSREYLRREWGVSLIENKENLGYAKACNQGIMAGQGEFVVILNTDIKVSAGWLEQMVQVAREDRRIGVVGPKMVNERNEIVGAGVTELDAYCSGRGWLTKDGPGVYDQQEDCFSVGGACYLIRREALNRVGAFDESYFFYFEESDLSLRMVEKGYRVVYAPQVKILHHHEGTLDANDRMGRQRRNVFFHQSQNRFTRKWKGVLEGGGSRRPESKCLIVFGVIPWDFRYQRPQHMYSRLAKEGYRILYINNTCQRGGKLTEIEENVYSFSPEGIGVAYRLLTSPSYARAMIQSIYQVLEELKFWNPSIWVDVPYWQQLIPYFDRVSLVYNCMDSYEEFSDLKASCPELEAWEEELARGADLIFASSQGLYEKMQRLNQQTYLIPNGVDREHFNLEQELPTPVDLKEIPRPIVGYYGAIADWFDLELMDYVTSKLPEYSFVLIGECTIDTQVLGQKPNVYLLGEKPYRELPNYVQHFRVALIPFRKNKLTASTNPVKLYEYLATGKPVVSVDLPEIRQFQDVVYIGKDKKDFVFYLTEALQREGWWVKRKRKRAVRFEDWTQRVLDIRELLGEHENRASRLSQILRLKADWQGRGE